ncbi:arsenate reductase [Luminiphilus sp.]|nr:arsenate reductase [Luminiphilus sp.]MDA9722133.1 arsenate reductase [Luminiphilus sp.]
MSQPTLFGIPNCDSVRKARKWLDDQGLAHEFIDLRADTPSAGKITQWLLAVGSERLVNRRSTTFKQLSEGDKAALEGRDTVSVLQAQPTLIKRPVLEWDDRVSVGFKAEEYWRLFNI